MNCCSHEAPGQQRVALSVLHHQPPALGSCCLPLVRICRALLTQTRLEAKAGDVSRLGLMTLPAAAMEAVRVQGLHRWSVARRWEMGRLCAGTDGGGGGMAPPWVGSSRLQWPAEVSHPSGEGREVDAGAASSCFCLAASSCLPRYEGSVATLD